VEGEGAGGLNCGLSVRARWGVWGGFGAVTHRSEGFAILLGGEEVGFGSGGG